MPINPLMMSALRALSYPDIGIAQTLKADRMLGKIKSTRQKLKYRLWDYAIFRGDYPIPVRIFEPKAPRSEGVLLFFHGGGWASGTIDTYSKTCALLADQTGRRVASVDYRLAPEHPFPCAIDDCFRVACALRDDERLHVGDEGITVIGDSAGGNIAAVVALMARDKGISLFERQILIYPATYFDHSPASPFPSVIENGYEFLLTSRRVQEYVSLYMCDTENLRNPYFSPLLAEDLSGLPRTLLITAEYDPLRDEGEAYGEKMRRFGNHVEMYRIPDALHGFFMLPVRYVHVRRAYWMINHFLDGAHA